MADTPNKKSLKRGFETSDASAKRIVQFAVGLSLSIVLVLATLWFAFKASMGAPPTTDRNDVFAWSYTDLKVTTIPQERRDQQEIAESRLKSYEWVDREAGIARIPIDRALEIIVESGLPQWGQAQPPKTLNDRIDERAVQD